MKPFLFLLLILPALLNAQQRSVSAPKTQVTIAPIDFSASIASISALSSKIKDISVTIKATRDQISSLQTMRTKIQGEIATTRKQIADIGNDESKNSQKAELEKKLAELTNQLNEINNKISELQNFLDAQIAEISKLENSIDQLRKKMEEIAARDRQQTEKKQTDETNETVATDEEKALAYAHVRIIMDSLPAVVSKLSLAERNLLSGFNSRFNSDAKFRFATTAYIKHSKASNYFDVMKKAGSSADQINRLLNAAREELIILSRN